MLSLWSILYQIKPIYFPNGPEVVILDIFVDWCYLRRIIDYSLKKNSSFQITGINTSFYFNRWAQTVKKPSVSENFWSTSTVDMDNITFPSQGGSISSS
ncbi:hypothetical protein Bca101_037316 [Brassica carinata]